MAEPTPPAPHPEDQSKSNGRIFSAQAAKHLFDKILAVYKANRSTWKAIGAVGAGIMTVVPVIYFFFSLYSTVNAVDEKIKHLGTELRHEIRADAEKTRHEIKADAEKLRQDARKDIALVSDKALQEVSLYKSSSELLSEMDSFLCRDDYTNALRKYRLFQNRVPILTVPIALRNSIFRAALAAYAFTDEYDLVKHEEIGRIEKSLESDPVTQMCPIVQRNLAVGSGS